RAATPGVGEAARDRFAFPGRGFGDCTGALVLLARQPARRVVLRVAIDGFAAALPGAMELLFLAGGMHHRNATLTSQVRLQCRKRDVLQRPTHGIPMVRRTYTTFRPVPTTSEVKLLQCVLGRSPSKYEFVQCVPRG